MMIPRTTQSVYIFLIRYTRHLIEAPYNNYLTNCPSPGPDSRTRAACTKAEFVDSFIACRTTLTVLYFPRMFSILLKMSVNFSRNDIIASFDWFFLSFHSSANRIGSSQLLTSGKFPIGI